MLNNLKVAYINKKKLHEDPRIKALAEIFVANARKRQQKALEKKLSNKSL